MLRKSTAHAHSTVAVVNAKANPHEAQQALNESRGTDVQVSGRGVVNSSVAFTLDIFVVRQPSLLQPNTVAPSPSFTWSCSRVCSWATLRQLRDDVLAVVTRCCVTDSRCKRCEELAEYLAHCFEQPRLFACAWNGTMVLNVPNAAQFVNTLLGIGCSSPATDTDVASPNHGDHARAVSAVVSTFLFPDLPKIK